MESFDIMQHLQMAIRRKYLIIIPFLVCLLGGLTFALIIPPVYQEETLILKIRKTQAIGTSSFLNGELENLTKQLRQQQQKL